MSAYRSTTDLPRAVRDAALRRLLTVKRERSETGSPLARGQSVLLSGKTPICRSGAMRSIEPGTQSSRLGPGFEPSARPGATGAPHAQGESGTFRAIAAAVFRKAALNPAKKAGLFDPRLSTLPENGGRGPVRPKAGPRINAVANPEPRLQEKRWAPGSSLRLAPGATRRRRNRTEFRRPDRAEIGCTPRNKRASSIRGFSIRAERAAISRRTSSSPPPASRPASGRRCASRSSIGGRRDR